MKVIVQKGSVERMKKGVHAVCIYADKNELKAASGKCELSTLEQARAVGFKAKSKQVLLMREADRWVVLAGLGEAEQVSAETLRCLAANVYRAIKGKGFEAAVFTVRPLGPLRSDAVAEAFVEGVQLAAYEFNEFKSKADKAGKLQNLVLQAENARSLPSIKKAAEQTVILTDGVKLARDLINAPSNKVTPTYLANQARSIAKDNSHIKCTVLSFEQMKKQGFGGIVAVGQGSDHPAQFIVLDYNPPKAKKTIALCGKGVTFDTGGISIKPSPKMELMKYDMAGSAAVLGALQTTAQLKLPVRVVGIIGATENMPSGKALKPGDIYKSLAGKTVEVLNTDAEGRLVLADCLHYAKRFKPDCVVDLATLTGACVVALGSEAIGLMSNNEKVAERLSASAERTNERLWRLPLWEEYGDLMKSDIADIRNISNTPEAGTITAGKFLEFFVDDLHWAHLDIAGTAWTERCRGYKPKGAVGIGVRLLTDFIKHWK